jgi:hypothetical protein
MRIMPLSAVFARTLTIKMIPRARVDNFHPPTSQSSPESLSIASKLFSMIHLRLSGHDPNARASSKVKGLGIGASV